MIKFLDLHKQYLSIEHEISNAIRAVIRDSSYIGGEFVSKFEKEFAEYLGVAGCLGVGNGTDALEIALEALNLPKGGEVIVPANTFIASSEAITRCGLKIVFCDVSESDFTIDVGDFTARITDNTVAVIAVHLYGHPCKMVELNEIAERHSLKVIEDCAQAHGAKIGDQSVGSFGDLGTFSFYPGKNLGAYGDGGAIVSRDTDLLATCRRIANHGRTAKYDHVLEGRNSRLDGIQAAVLSVKLQHLDDWTQTRIDLANLYRQVIVNPNVTLPKERFGTKHVYHLFVVRTSTEDRDRLKSYLESREIQVGVHYPKSLPVLEAYRYLGQQEEGLFGWTCGSTVLSLPIGDQMNDTEVQIVADAINDFR